MFATIVGTARDILERAAQGFMSASQSPGARSVRSPSPGQPLHERMQRSLCIRRNVSAGDDDLGQNAGQPDGS